MDVVIAAAFISGTTAIITAARRRGRQDGRAERGHHVARADRFPVGG